MAAEFVADLQGALEVDAGAGPPLAQRGLGQGFGGSLDGEPVRPLLDDGEAAAIAEMEAPMSTVLRS